MTKLSIEFEKLNKELTTKVKNFEKLWRESYDLLSPSIPAELAVTLDTLTQQVNQLIDELPAHLTKDISGLLAGVSPASIGSVFGDLQNLAGDSSLLQAGLAGILTTGIVDGVKPNFAPFSDIAVIDGCFGSGINIGCIASGSLNALGSLKNIEGLLGGLGGDLNQTLGMVFGNIANPQALLGQLPAGLIPQITSAVTGLVKDFGPGIADALGSLANPAQMLGSVLNGLPSMVNSIASSMEGLMGSLTGSLAGAISGALGSFDLGGLLGGLDLGGLLGGLDLGGLLGGFDFGGGLDIAICGNCF